MSTPSRATWPFSPSRWSPNAAFLIVTLVLLAAICLLTYSTHEVYEGVTEGDGIGALDHPGLRVAVWARTPVLTAFAVSLTESGGRIGNPVIAILVCLAFLARRRDLTPPLVMLPALAGSLAITVVGKSVIGRVRPPRDLALPPYETSPSFPSGHTLNAAVLATVVAFLALRTLRRRIARALAVTACTLFALGIGLSRIYLGQHWPTDVLAGLLIGMAWGLSVVLAHGVWHELRRRRARRIEESLAPGEGQAVSSVARTSRS